MVRELNGSCATAAAMGRLWMRSAVLNLVSIDAVLDGDVLRPGRPVVIAASGPTLARCIPDIARVRDRVELWALPSAAPALAAAGLQPDLVVLTDPGALGDGPPALRRRTVPRRHAPLRGARHVARRRPGPPAEPGHVPRTRAPRRRRARGTPGRAARHRGRHGPRPRARRHARPGDARRARPVRARQRDARPAERLRHAAAARRRPVRAAPRARLHPRAHSANRPPASPAASASGCPAASRPTRDGSRTGPPRSAAGSSASTPPPSICPEPTRSTARGSGSSSRRHRPAPRESG